METLIQDLKYAVRSLRNSAGFTTVAVLTLALGIGANAAIFSVVNGVLLEPLAYRDPGRLVTVDHYYPSLNGLKAGVSAPGFRDYSARSDVFATSAVERRGGAMNLTGAGEPEQVIVRKVTGQFFPLLGVPPAFGRAIQPDEAQAGKDHVAVLTWAFWERKFGGDRNVAGRTILLDDQAYQIVGVMPASFKDFFSGSTDLYTPLVFPPSAMTDDRRTSENLSFLGRLLPGETVEQAQTRMHAFAAQLRAGYPASYPPDWDLLVTPLSTAAAGGVRAGLLLLLGAVALVLLIACANVANLQLARAVARARDVAVRVALGASPRRLARLLLTESVLLAVLGGGVGVGLAAWAVPALLALGGNDLPPTARVALNLPVLLFALAVSLATGLAFGLAPALHLVRTNLHETLKEGGRGAVAEHGSLAMRRGLVVSTVALALTLLVGAGLLIRSFSRLVAVDPGFQPNHLLTFQVTLPDAKFPNDTVRAVALQRITDALSTTPGVVAAGGTSNVPLDGNWSTSSFNVEGYQPPKDTPSPWGDMRVVTPGYFAALRAPLLAGRPFNSGDRDGGTAVCVVDDEMVRRYWPHVDPLGKRITFNNFTDSSIHWIQVVGVVGHLASEGLDAKKRVQVYFPLAQVPQSNFGFTVRTTVSPLAELPAVTTAVHGVDADLPLANVHSMDDLVQGTLGSRRFAMLLLTGFAALAMVLASIGLYGVMSYTVSQRSRELGVRLALGAATSDVLGLVLRQGVTLALAGVGVGLVAAFALTRVMRTMLFGVGATDPLTFVTIPLVLVAVAMLATYLPARRATRTDPIVALRAE